MKGKAEGGVPPLPEYRVVRRANCFMIMHPIIYVEINASLSFRSNGWGGLGIG